MPATPDATPISFTTVAGDPDSPWILHVPHASTRIPPTVRARIVLDDDALGAELSAMTDAHTDRLAGRTSDSLGSRRPWSFVNGLSRLVVDPERFPDAREAMNRVGMGAVYTRTSTGARLRAEDPFRGTYVPLRHYGLDDRVESIMLEVRRDAYLRSGGAPDDEAIDRLAGAAARLIDRLART